MRVFPKAIALTTKSRFHVKRTYASIRGLVVRTITSGKTRISVINFLTLITILHGQSKLLDSDFSHFTNEV